MDEEDKAYCIVREFQAMIERVSAKAMFGVPEDKLPYTKKTIKEAIKRVVALEKVKWPRDESLIRHLKKDYVTLSKFVNFEEFGLKAAIYDQGMSLFFQKASQEEKDRALKITKKIKQEEGELRQDIADWYRSF